MFKLPKDVRAGLTLPPTLKPNIAFSIVDFPFWLRPDMARLIAVLSVFVFMFRIPGNEESKFCDRWLGAVRGLGAFISMNFSPGFPPPACDSLSTTLEGKDFFCFCAGM